MAVAIQKAMSRNQNASLVTRRSEGRGWTQILARYRTPSPTRSIIELVITAGPLILLWFLMWATLDLAYWVCLSLAVPAAGFLVRLFMIQHDCGHGAFFHHRIANDWVGRVIGVLTQRHALLTRKILGERPAKVGRHAIAQHECI